LNDVADHYDLRKDIHLNNEVLKMTWHDQGAFWEVVTSKETIRTRYVFVRFSVSPLLG
jgi:cation diffusion facilitator CzcD-associated flavoprotein CzcO